MTQVFSALVAIAKAIPTIDKFIRDFYAYFTNKLVEANRDYLATHENKRLVLMKQIANAKDDHERIILSILLNDFNSRK